MTEPIEALTVFLRRRPTLGAGEAWSLLQIDAVRLVDVRSDEAWAQGHAPGAVHVPTDDLERINGLVDPDTSIVVVDGNGQTLRAVCKRLRGLGYRANEVSGGMTAWRLAGLPVVGVPDDGDGSHDEHA